MLLLKLTSRNLNLILKNRCSRQLIIRNLVTSQIRLETETNKLIRLRREREAREEQTTGFDKMIQLNIHHLNILKKNDSPELNRKRDIHMFWTLTKLGLTFGFLCIPLWVAYWFYCKQVCVDILDNDREFWIDGWPWQYKKE